MGVARRAASILDNSHFSSVLSLIERGRLPSTEEDVHHEHGCQDASHIGQQTGRQSVTGLSNAHSAEINSQHVKGCFRAAINGAYHVADERIWAMGLED